MKKINYLLLSFILFFLVVGNVYAEDTGANGQGAGLGLTRRDVQQCDSVASDQWIYTHSFTGYRQMGDFNMDTGQREELYSPSTGPEYKDETSWRHCCEVGNNVADGIIWACDLYEINPDYLSENIENDDSNTVSNNNTLSEEDQKDASKAITCGYTGSNFIFDYNFVVEGKQKDMYDDNRVICCNPSYEENGKTYTQCTRYVAQSLIDNGYETVSDNDNTQNNSTTNTPDPGAESCEEIFGDAMELIEKVFGWICIAVPILLIVLGSVDFGNAVLSSDQEAMQKAVKRFTIRCIVAVAIFFLPMLVNLVFSFPGISKIPEEFFCNI